MFKENDLVVVISGGLREEVGRIEEFSETGCLIDFGKESAINKYNGSLIEFHKGLSGSKKPYAITKIRKNNFYWIRIERLVHFNNVFDIL